MLLLLIQVMWTLVFFVGTSVLFGGNAPNDNIFGFVLFAKVKTQIYSQTAFKLARPRRR